MRQRTSLSVIFGIWVVILQLPWTNKGAESCAPVRIWIESRTATASHAKGGFQEFTQSEPPKVKMYLTQKLDKTYKSEAEQTTTSGPYSDSNGSVWHDGGDTYEKNSSNATGQRTIETDPVTNIKSTKELTGTSDTLQLIKDWIEWNRRVLWNGFPCLYKQLYREEEHTTHKTIVKQNGIWNWDVNSTTKIKGTNSEHSCIHSAPVGEYQLPDETSSATEAFYDSWFNHSGTVTIISPTERTFTGATPPGPNGIDELKEKLSDPFDTPLLIQIVRQKIPALPPTWGGGESTAFLTLTADERTATGQRMAYRFKLTDLEEDVQYTLKWKEVKTYPDGSKVVTGSQKVTFQGTKGEKIVGGESGFTCEVPSEPCVVSIEEVSLSVGEGCDTGCDESGQTDEVGLGSVSVRIGLGMAANGRPAGHVHLSESAPTALITTPSALQLYSDEPTLNIIRQKGELRQVKAPQLLLNVVTNNRYSFRIEMYYNADVGATLVNGLYPTFAPPYKTYTISNPDGADATSRVHVTVSEGAASKLFQYRYVANTKSWFLTYPDGIGEVELSRTSDIVNGTSEVQRITRDMAGAVVHFASEVYREYDWGTAKIKDIAGMGGDERVTTYYYRTTALGVGIANPPLTQIVRWDGSWERIQYDTVGRVTNILTAFLNQEPTWDTSLCRNTYRVYAPVGTGDTGILQPDTPRMETDYLLGQEIGRRYRVVKPGEKQEIVCVTPGAAWNAADNLVTTTKYYTSGAFVNLVQSIRRPDGTMTIYTYADNVDGTRTRTVSEGAPNALGTAVVSGIRVVTQIGTLGETLSETTTDISSGITTSSRIYSNFDPFQRWQTVTSLGGIIEETTYSCCGIETKRDRDGLLTMFLYDSLGRQTGERKWNIMLTNVLDAAGNIIVRQRIGTDNSVMSLGGAAYNTAGEIIRQTNALNGVTHFSETTDANGQLVKTTTFPDLGTRIETFFKDGSIDRITGTAVHPYRKQYGVVTSSGHPDLWKYFEREIKLSNAYADTTEIRTNFFDLVGRNYKTAFDFGTGTAPAEQQIFNLSGQLWKTVDADGVTSIYEYNSRGEVEFTTVDVDGNGRVAASKDRIQQTVRDVTNAGIMGQAVQRTRRYVWEADGSATARLAETAEVSVDGLKVWKIIHVGANNVIRKTERSPLDANSSYTVTEFSPDNSRSVARYSNGRLESSVRLDNLGTQVEAKTFGYEPHGRLGTIDDARNGTTAQGFNNADQLTSLTTPIPGPGYSAQTTTTFYNNMGQSWKVTQPDNTSQTNEFFHTGLLKKTSGTRTYPVEYTYDAQGRMKTMKTWQNFSANSGVATTTWNYDSYRGWLTSKLYHGQAVGTEYTYTKAGRLKTRRWARTGSGSQRILTTYVYGYDNDGISDNQHGDLVGITYANDPQSTPGVTYTYDRVGRKKAVLRNGMTTAMTYPDTALQSTEAYTGGTLNGLTVTTAFDTRLRVSSLALNSSPALSRTFTYDAASRLKTVSEGSQVATYSYLAHSPLVEQISLTSGGSARMTTTKQYDSINRLKSIANVPSGANPVSFGYLYNNANQRTRVDLADGSHWSYGYDLLGQVISGKRYWPDTTFVPGQQYEYVFDTIGNRTSTKAGGDSTGGNLRTATYIPNLLNQYTSRTIPNAFDVMGLADATATISINGSSAGVYRKGDYYQKVLTVANSSVPVWQSVTVSSSAGSSVGPGRVFIPKTPEAPTHDLDGNLTVDGRWNYTWDAENRLVKQETRTDAPAGSKRRLDFEYDYMGRRIKKVVTNLDTSQVIDEIRFVYDGWNLIAQLNANLTPRRSFVWGLDVSGTMQGAGGVGGLLMVREHANSTYHFAGYDGNGNLATLIESANGTASATYEYGPFAESIRVSGTMAKLNPFRFSTKYTDDESDLVYYGYRYYNPSTGRWLSRDPIEEDGGLNLYGFVANNPLTRIDRLGLELVEIVIMTYIEWATVTAPPYGEVFEGDGHGAGGGSFRTIYRLQIETCGPKKGLIPGSIYKDTGITRLLDPVTGAVLKEAKASGATLKGTVTTGANTVTVNLTGDETNPLHNPAPFVSAPSISYDITLTFDTKIGKGTLAGGHDGFPSYDLVVGGNMLWNFSHVKNGTTPLSLFPPLDIKFLPPRKFDIEKCCE